jgi:hypothetical protein
MHVNGGWPGGEINSNDEGKEWILGKVNEIYMDIYIYI